MIITFIYFFNDTFPQCKFSPCVCITALLTSVFFFHKNILRRREFKLNSGLEKNPYPAGFAVWNFVFDVAVYELLALKALNYVN